MYYYYQCSYCSKLFYTYSNPRFRKYAAERLYRGIKQHLIYYKEDHKEHQFDDHPQIEIRDMYRYMYESETKPRGGIPL